MPRASYPTPHTPIPIFQISLDYLDHSITCVILNLASFPLGGLRTLSIHPVTDDDTM